MRRRRCVQCCWQPAVHMASTRRLRRRLRPSHAFRRRKPPVMFRRRRRRLRPRRISLRFRAILPMSRASLSLRTLRPRHHRRFLFLESLTPRHRRRSSRRPRSSFRFQASPVRRLRVRAARLLPVPAAPNRIYPWTPRNLRWRTRAVRAPRASNGGICRKSKTWTTARLKTWMFPITT